MKKITITFIVLLFGFTSLIAQSPQTFKYQAVARDNLGKILVNQLVGLRISILKDSPLGATMYMETHTKGTNEFGIVTLNVGGGTLVTGNFQNINWSNGEYFIKTELDIAGTGNYIFIGSSQLLSVPFALHSEYATKAGKATNDQDTSATNELQTIVKTGNTITLSQNGGSVTDSDNQTITLTGNQLSISNGNTLVLSGAVDLDSDPTNELQILNKNNDTIYLSQGNFIVLPHDVDRDSTNELQVLHLSNDTLFLSKTNNVVFPKTGTIGNANGDLQYWNGSQWIILPVGSQSQTLRICNGVPVWGECLPQLTTTTISNITASSAIGGGNIINDGGTLTFIGVCWSINPNPIITDPYTSESIGVSGFTSNLTSLSDGTTYYVRAYATNSAGTAYGNQVSFTTQTITIPTVTTIAVNSITIYTAVGGGNVTSDGWATVTQKGICWDINQTPLVSDSHTSDGIGLGSFTSNLTNLSNGTTYYVRAYATNSAGTAYGSQISFTTLGYVQMRLDLGETPKQIYDSGMPLDSLYGKTYQGGLIFYLNTNIGTGLVSATSNQSNGTAWGCLGTVISGADGATIGTGNQNTIDIDIGCTTDGIGADICANLSLNTYSDWFLPSKDELDAMYVNLKSKGYGDFPDETYWSSTEFNNNNAWSQYFGGSTTNYYSKTDNLRVRAIRAF